MRQREEEFEKEIDDDNAPIMQSFKTFELVPLLLLTQNYIPELVASRAYAFLTVVSIALIQVANANVLRIEKDDVVAVESLT